MDRCVLIVAPEGDTHARVVAKRIEARGALAIIIDSADFPNGWQLSYAIGNGPQQFELRRDGTALDQENLAGVWWRRPRRYTASPDVTEEHLRHFVTSEARAAFEGWLHCLGDKVVNPIAAEYAGSYKLLQLRIAREVGLTIPRTLSTNCPADALSFRGGNKDTIFKPFTAANWTLFATRRLASDALEQIEAVSYAPVIFQQEIDKVADIRVNVLDQAVYAVSFRSDRTDAPIDWRIDPARECSAHDLPAHIVEGLKRFVVRLGLRFAACDFALTGDGEYVFFEANTSGQWLFAEIMAGQPLSAAFAEALLRGGSSAAPN